MIYCFDIDGVLADKTSIQKLDCTKEADRFRFEKAVPDLPVRENFVCLVNDLGSVLGGVFFLTSRAENLRGITNKWLLDNGVKVRYELYMRPLDNNEKCQDLKINMIKTLMKTFEGSSIMYFDDNPFTCLAVQKKLGKFGVSVCEVL